MNRLGSEEISIIPGCRKHKGTKIHAIVTTDKIPLGITFSDAKTHDSKMVIKTIEKIPISTRDAIIVADKGYIGEILRKQLKRNRRINFWAVPKKNMKKRLTPRQKEKMSKRVRVEHFFADLKRFNRMNQRMERTLEAFSSFCFIAMIALIANRT